MIILGCMNEIIHLVLNLEIIYSHFVNGGNFI